MHKLGAANVSHTKYRKNLTCNDTIPNPTKVGVSEGRATWKLFRLSSTKLTHGTQNSEILSHCPRGVPLGVPPGARQTLDVVLANRMHNLFGSITKAGFQSASCFYPGMVEWN